MATNAWRVLAAAVLAGVLVLPRPSAADPFTPGEVFSVDFSLRGVDFPVERFGVPDILAVFVLADVIQPVGSFTVRLVDRGALIGTYSSAQLNHPAPFRDWAGAYFVSSDYPFNYRNPTIIDFSSILNGTFDGRFEFSIGSGQINLDPRWYSVFLGASVPSGESYGIQVAPAAPVPEPASMLLLGTGLAAIAARRRRKFGAQALQPG